MNWTDVQWVASHWKDYLNIIVSLAVFLSITGGAIWRYFQRRKKYWKCHKSNNLPIRQLITENYEYQDIYLTVPANEKLGELFKEGTKNILLKGPSGVGKSRLIIEFLSGLEKKRNVYILDSIDVDTKGPPPRCRGSIIILDDLYNFESIESRINLLLRDERFTIIATVPDKKYRPDKELYAPRFWQYLTLDEWSEEKGNELAEKCGKEFNKSEFKGTPLSILAPLSQMQALYSRAPEKEQVALRTLKMLKDWLGCFVDSEFVVDASKEVTDAKAVINVCAAWCLEKDGRHIMRDEHDEAIDQTFKLDNGAYIFETLCNSKGKHHAEYFFYLGNKFNESNDPSKAVKCYEKAIEINPENSATHNNLGNLLDDLKRFEEAETEYRKAIEINPEYSEAHYNLGVLLQKRERFEEAETEYRKAIEINPEYSEAHYNLGNLLKKRERFEEAETEYRKAIDINPEYSEAHNNLGNLLKKRERFEEAETEYRKAIDINPEYSEAMANLGIMYIQMGEKAKRCKWLKKAMEKKDKLPDKGERLIKIIEEHCKPGQPET